MRKPVISRPRSAAAAFSLSRKLPRLQLPLSALSRTVGRPKPSIGRPGRAIFGTLSSAPGGAPASVANPPVAAPAADRCRRCNHPDEQHPVRYVCDKYPHPDPLQLCGCEAERLDPICETCGHKSRWHKPRRRCKAAACHCWGYDGAE